MIKQLLLLFMLLCLCSQESFSLPIDWHGEFGVDTSKVYNYRNTKDATAATGAGSQIPPQVSGFSGDVNNASFQSYLFKLQPQLIVNDSATIFSEFTTGYGYGGFLGDNSTKRKGQTAGKDTYANALYHQNFSNEDANLVVTKLYMELYSDTATYIIGRHPLNWALGGIFNQGSEQWSRHSTIQDGIMANFKIGNFKISPFYSYINTTGSFTKATKTKFYGLSALYDNVQRGFAFGVLYGKRSSNYQDPSQLSSAGNIGVHSLTSTKVNITDVYLRKAWNDLIVQVEVPIMGGELGHVYNGSYNSKYEALGVLTETKYKLNDNWKFNLKAGHLSGNNGSYDKFEALYLNPNYQVANILFRYNAYAVSDTGQSLYDSYMTNAMYAALQTNYTQGNWDWYLRYIYAVANETAKTGKDSFNHEANTSFVANLNQKDDLGHEVDLGFEYQWNPKVNVGVDLGYHFVGDYYQFTNNVNSKPEVKDRFLTKLGVGIVF